jgi:restriction endonuclease
MSAVLWVADALRPKYESRATMADDERERLMQDLAVQADPLDRARAQQAYRRLQEIPTHKDIRRHHVRSYVEDNHLYIHIPSKSPPRIFAVLAEDYKPYGKYLRVGVRTDAKKGYHAFCDVALHPGFLVTTVHTHMGRLHGAYDLRFADRTRVDEDVDRFSLDNEYESLSETPFWVEQFDVSAFREIVCASLGSALPLTAFDYLQAGYATVAPLRLGSLAKSAKSLIGQCSDEEYSQVARISPECATLLKAPSLRAFASSFCDIDSAVIERFLDRYAHVSDTPAPSEFSKRVADYLSRCHLAFTWHPRLTAFGLRLPVFCYHVSDVTTLEIAADQLGDDHASCVQLAKTYWYAVSSLPFTQVSPNVEVLSPSEVFLSRTDYRDRISALEASLTGDEAAWDRVTNELWEECQSLKQWTIPWGAYVEIDYLGFKAVELFEGAGSVNCVWRSLDGKITWSLASPHRQSFFCAHDNEVACRVHAHWKMFTAALIRDFWVAEERRKVFGVSMRRTHRGNTKRRKETLVIYLPRVRYDQPIQQVPGTLGERIGGRARHFVQPFFRKANPSPLQAEFARLNYVSVPDGHTYVRGHFRGGAEAAAVYRSRSAMQLLYRTVFPSAPEPELEMDWFRFELLVRTLLERQAFEIVRTSTRGKTDDGIDVLAVQRTNQGSQTWLVQAKCYGPRQHVGPDTMREMIGSISDFQLRYPDQTAAGMIVTTSTFSGEAQRLALAHGIKLVDGANLRAIAAAENTRSN